MRRFTRVSVLAVVVAGTATVASAQSALPADSAPRMLRIGREEVRAGKTASHNTHEAGWANAFAKSQIPTGWVAMTSVTGPSEAWFITPYASWEEIEKANTISAANENWTAEEAKLWAADSDMLSRESAVIAVLQPALSYRSGSSLAHFRYMQVNTIRVRPGRTRDFIDNWTAVVAAHEKAGMDEGWAVYQVTSGAPAGTYMYLQARKSLADLDKDAAMHAAPAYRDALGDAGRARATELTQNAIEFQQNLLFALKPGMSVVPKEWGDADPFWAPKPPPPPAKPAAKK